MNDLEEQVIEKFLKMILDAQDPKRLSNLTGAYREFMSATQIREDVRLARQDVEDAEQTDENDYDDDELDQPRVWECKIVVSGDQPIPDGFDVPPRCAAISAIESYGIEVLTCFSGWGGTLTREEQQSITRLIGR